MNTKTCKGCNETKNIEEFGLQDNDKPRNTCKVCRRSRAKETHKLRKEGIRLSNRATHKECATCGKTKALIEFHPVSVKGTKLRSRCKACMPNPPKDRSISSAHKTSKACSKCGEMKNIEGFYFKNKTKNIRNASCIECDKKAYREKHPLKERIKRDPYCTVKGCSRKHMARGYCQLHYNRWLATGEVGCVEKLVADAGRGHVQNGYRRIKLADGSSYLEHRQVWEEANGRKLLPGETIHHKNGDRLDNRIENLELWSSHQPFGQRVEDKLFWAKEIIALYDETFYIGEIP